MRDHNGRELAIFYSDKNMLKSVNLYGSGMIGKVNVNYTDSDYVQGPDGEWFWTYKTSYDRSYYVKDHLGSIHLTFDENNEILNAQDYHAYGEVLRGYVAGENSRYLFTEKERDTETSFDYFGARYYDSELGRWLSVDPLASKYPGWSPYNYTLNNPLKYVDPDGKFPWYIHAQVITNARGGNKYLEGMNQLFIKDGIHFKNQEMHLDI